MRSKDDVESAIAVFRGLLDKLCNENARFNRISQKELMANIPANISGEITTVTMTDNYVALYEYLRQKNGPIDRLSSRIVTGRAGNVE
jgi:hypothetical protein